MAKAKKSKYHFDTSQYISMRVALIGSAAILVVLVLIGIKYSAFNSMLLATRGGSPDPRTIAQYCATIRDACKSLAERGRVDCRLAAYQEAAACKSQVPRDHPNRRVLLGDCDFAKDVTLQTCNSTADAEKLKCDADYQKCIKPTATPDPKPKPQQSQFPYPTQLRYPQY